MCPFAVLIRLKNMSKNIEKRLKAWLKVYFLHFNEKKMGKMFANSKNSCNLAHKLRTILE